MHVNSDLVKDTALAKLIVYHMTGGTLTIMDGEAHCRVELGS